jgi:hypothetical protein
MGFWALNISIDAGMSEGIWSCWDGMNIFCLWEGHEFCRIGDIMLGTEYTYLSQLILEALIFSLVVFEVRKWLRLNEVIGWDLDPKGFVLSKEIPQNLLSLSVLLFLPFILSRYAEKKGHEKTKQPSGNSGRNFLLSTLQILILDFQFENCQKFLLFKPLSIWHFAMVA